MGLNGSRGPPGFRGPTGPQGPPGYNATQSSSGGSSVHGSSGPPGSPGTGNWSLCQYKNKREPGQTAGVSADSVVTLREDEHKVTGKTIDFQIKRNAIAHPVVKNKLFGLKMKWLTNNGQMIRPIFWSSERHAHSKQEIRKVSKESKLTLPT